MEWKERDTTDVEEFDDWAEKRWPRAWKYVPIPLRIIVYLVSCATGAHDG